MDHTWRIRFAWWPVPLWEPEPKSRMWVRRSGKFVWFHRVFEIQTLRGEWVAYKAHQAEIMRPPA